MILVSILGYLADAWILTTYFLMSRTGRARKFHWANAIGCLPLLGVEVLTGAWPVVPLHVAFGIIGVYGLRRKS